MANKRRSERPSLGEQLSSGAKRGLVFIILIALAALIILAAFQGAGAAGAFIDHFMALGFGWTRLVAALALIALAFGVVMPARSASLRGPPLAPRSYSSRLQDSSTFSPSRTNPSRTPSSRPTAAMWLLFQQVGTRTVGFAAHSSFSWRSLPSRSFSSSTPRSKTFWACWSGSVWRGE